MIFPNLKDKTFGYINLNLEAIEWFDQKGLDANQANILLDPKKCEDFVNDVHKKYSLDFSYGGWMEDRTFLWRDGYLEKNKIFTHLGVDINVPNGTEIATDFKSEVVRVYDNHDHDGGWGPHVVLKNLSHPIYMIYGHLDEDITCKVGDILEKDTIFAKVGIAPSNGNWFPHVHVQTINPEYFNEIEKNNSWDDFDGYGLKSEIEANVIKHKDPMEFISLI